jgi:deazaflavin-dependent oxidoreductase (nitroreductase family)
MKTPKFILRLGKLPPQLIYALGLGSLMGRRVLLLTTTGRKSGKARVTPLQYVEKDGVIYVRSAHGVKSDWVRNLLANSQVEVRIKSRRFQAQAEVVTDPEQIINFTNFQLQERSPAAETILHTAGTKHPFTPTQLEEYAATLAVVVIHPAKD